MKEPSSKRIRLNLITDIVRAVFLFGDPVASVISTRKRRWTKQHFENCGVPEVNPETADIYGADILGYERIFDAWTRRQSFDLLCLRYEMLYQNLEILSQFFGRHVFIPPYRPRRTDCNLGTSEHNLLKIQKNYSRLIEKIKHAPDAMVFRAT